MLENIDELFRRETKMAARLGGAQEGITPESIDNISAYAHSAAVAVMLYGATCQACYVVEQRAAAPLYPPQPPKHIAPAPTPRPVPPVTQPTPTSTPQPIEPDPIEEEEVVKPEEEKREVEGGRRRGKFFTSFLSGISRTINVLVGNEDEGNEIL